jgi:hypothetical protein
MDVFFEQGLSRNGIDEPYFAFLGGRKKRERLSDVAAENQLQDLENRFSDQQSIEAQNNNLVLLSNEKSALENERGKAKSRKTKATLDSRIRAYDSYIKEYKFTLESLKKNQVEAIEATSPQREIVISPSPIVTSQDGQIELPKKQVFIQETSQDAIETQVSPLLAKEEGILPTSVGTQLTQASTKKNNTLLFVGIGVAALIGILLIRKNN